MEHSFRFIYMISAILIVYEITTDRRSERAKVAPLLSSLYPLSALIFAIFFLNSDNFFSSSTTSSSSSALLLSLSLLLCFLPSQCSLSLFLGKFISASNLFYGLRTEYYINLNSHQIVANASICKSFLFLFFFRWARPLRVLHKPSIIYRFFFAFRFHKLGLFESHKTKKKLNQVPVGTEKNCQIIKASGQHLAEL